MPALFWLIVIGLAAAVGLAAAAPWLRRDGAPPGGRAPGTAVPAGLAARPPWLVPVAIIAGAIVAAVLTVMLIPGFPVFVFFLPLIWWQRRRRPPGGPRPPGDAAP